MCKCSLARVNDKIYHQVDICVERLFLSNTFQHTMIHSYTVIKGKVGRP